MTLKSMFVVSALAALPLLTACGGGGSGAPTTLPSTPNNVVGQTASAKQAISFRVPMFTASTKTPSATTASSARRPLYVSPDTAQGLVIVDGQKFPFTIATKSPASPGGTVSSGPSPIPGSNGETISYSSTAVTDASGAGYYQVNLALDMFPGDHTLGIVLQAADGFVLSEAQETYRLTGGSNPPATMYLKGVADSAFLCDWPNCDGTWGPPDANGTYTVMAFASDHEGDAIPQQLDANGQAIPLANGPFSMVETDNLGVVTITNVGPFTDPGADTTMHNGYASSVPQGWKGGHEITIHCNTMGTTKVAMQLASTSPAAGVVTGFDYTAQIDPSKDPVDPANGTPWAVTQTAVWTTPGQYIGTVPTFQDFGNAISVNCDANFNLTIQ